MAPALSGTLSLAFLLSLTHPLPVSPITARHESVCYQRNRETLWSLKVGFRQRDSAWPVTRMQLTLKYGLLVSAALAGITSAAIYVVAYLLFTIHEEIGIPPNVALHLAQWTFPVVFLASFVGYWLWKSGPR